MKTILFITRRFSVLEIMHIGMSDPKRNLHIEC